MAEYIEREAAINAIDESLKQVFVLPVGKSIMDRVPAADVRPVVLCGVCELHGHCYTEDVFAFVRLAEENRFCSVGKVKTNGAKREEKLMDDNRRYVAVSIKHTEYRWKFGMPCWLWGFHQTEDDEPRCFAGYTQYPDKAERYALGDFKEHGYGAIIKDDEPVKLSVDFCKKWKKYDTVLVDAEQYEAYCRIADLPIEPPKEE